MRTTKIIGLTGQTGAGKSSVSKIINSQNFPIIDCDEVAHAVTDQEKGCLADLALEFSISILNPDATLNRRRLAAIVFEDKEKLERLNDIVFPYIKKRIKEMVKEMDAKKNPLVVLDAPTLFESGINSECDYIVSVIAPVSLRQNRIVIRDHLTDDEARVRISAQHDDEFYTERSNYVIVNKDDMHDLRLKTLEMIEDMCRTFMKGSGK